VPVIDTADAFPGDVTRRTSVARTRRVWLVDPAEFTVVYAINPHMRDESGSLHKVDASRARAEWDALRRAIEATGVAVEVLPAPPGLPDAVFVANPALPVPAEVTCGSPAVVPSHMAAAERRAEVGPVVAALVRAGSVVEPLPDDVPRFEGTGDGLWHPGRRLLWGGVGPRTDRRAWEVLATRYDVEILAIELVDPDFYHLDTALALIDERTALWVPAAFTERSRALIRRVIPDLVEVPDVEARRGFAANAWSPDGRTVLIQAGNPITEAALRARGFDVVPLDTTELRKAGGSVFCLKLAGW
jgi:N-dimethylarginine dimethylaminohydrolase